MNTFKNWVMQIHHPDEKSTPPQKIAQQNFFTQEPISGRHTAHCVLHYTYDENL